MDWSKMSLPEEGEQVGNNVGEQQDTNNDSSEGLLEEFDPNTGRWKKADKDKLKEKINNLRQGIQAKGQEQEYDPLEMKQRKLAQGLRDIGLSEKDLGKTGDSRTTGPVTDEQRAIAASQIKNAKQFMLQRRSSEGK